MARPRRTSVASTTSSLPSEQASPQELSSMYDYLAKIILLGPSGAGKSCVLHRFTTSTFRTLSSQTIGVEFASKIVRIGTPPHRKRVKLQLWDTAGTERFRSVSRSYYRGAAGAILIYDVASKESFAQLPTFLMDARALASPGLCLILAGNKSDLAEPSLNSYPKENGIAVAGEDQIPSSASSRQSAFPFDTGGGGGGGRSRGESINLTGTKWTATTSAEGKEVSTEIAGRWASRSGVPVTMEVSALSGENVDELFHRLARMILTKIELGEIDPDDPQSGIQYGDSGGWDGGSVTSGITADDGTLRRRKKGGNVLLKSASEWGDVFRAPASRGRRGCC